MPSNYDLRLLLKNEQRKRDISSLRKMGAQQAAQNLIDSYMSPTQLSDLYNRLGEPVSLNTSESTVSDYSFPPYCLDVTKTQLGVRAGGFKQLNDRINAVQLNYRSLTGEIRTKITEWDISLYLQESWITDKTIFDLSLLYRIFTDNISGYSLNPSGDPDTRALAYGLINAAISYDYRYSNYNPTADPDLIYWVPPTEDLSVSQAVPKGHQETTPIGGLNIFGWKVFQRNVSKWIWDVPPPPEMNEWQKEQVRIATEGNWVSWYPQFWQLFFDSSDPSVISEDDYASMLSHFKDLSKSRHKRDISVPRIKPDESLISFVAEGGTSSRLGLNLKSPIWYGYPFGRYPDPRSLQGYLNNTNPLAAKIDITGEDLTRNINRSYSYGNPMDGIKKLLNGWSSTFTITTYITEDRTVYYPEADPQYVTESITVPSSLSGTVTDMFPEGSGTITLASSTQRTIQQKVFGYFGAVSHGADGESPMKTWGSQSQSQTIDPSIILQIDHFNNMDIDSILDPYTTKTIIIVGEPLTVGGMPSFVLIAPIQKVQIDINSFRPKEFLWWKWNEQYVENKWVYQIDMSRAQGFSINTGSEDIVVASPHLPLQYFSSERRFKGVFFSIPQRTLTSTQNVITDGWVGAIYPDQGAAIATALLTPFWYNGVVYNRAPLHRILDSLYNVLAPLEDIITELRTLFAPVSSSIIQNIISQFSPEVQTKQTIQNAYTLFKEENRGTTLSQLESLQTSYSDLLEAINNIRDTRGTYTYLDLFTFYKLYPVIVGGLLGPTLLKSIRSYLDILYEQRLDILAKRLNKEDGTLVNCSRIEFVLARMQDSLAENITSPSDLLIQTKLEVKHKVTNISLTDRATKAVSDLPTELVRIVYVPVMYEDNGDIIRPPAGIYTLYSQEILDQTSLTPAQWYISFEVGLAPKIIKNVITSLDAQKLGQILTNPNLTDLEKICYARTLEDWWEIVIPEVNRPLAENYVTTLLLVLQQSDSYISQFLELTGGTASSPVAESTERIELGSTWVTSLEIQKTLQRLNSTT